MPDLVQLERPQEGVALVTMSNPSIENRGSFEGVSQLAAAVRDAREGGARVCVLASGVEGHWFEHACLSDLHDMATGQPVKGNPGGWFLSLAEITHDELVTIAAISGNCTGGGAELGWACDLRIAEPQATFGQPEVMISLATGIGGTSRLMRLIGRTATAEMVLDGAPLTAQRIYELGGLNRLVPRGRAIEVALEWAGRLAQRPHDSLVALKKMLKGAENMHLDEALANEQNLFQSVALSKAGIEGMRETQARFEAGETISEVYGGPRE